MVLNFIFKNNEIVERMLIFDYCTLLPPANEVCEGYVFTGVCLSTGGVSAPLHAGIHTPPGQTPPGQTPPVHAGIRSTSGRYASHWNAFLLHYNLLNPVCLLTKQLSAGRFSTRHV